MILFFQLYQGFFIIRMLKVNFFNCFRTLFHFQMCLEQVCNVVTSNVFPHHQFCDMGTRNSCQKIRGVHSSQPNIALNCCRLIHQQLQSGDSEQDTKLSICFILNLSILKWIQITISKFMSVYPCACIHFSLQ